MRVCLKSYSVTKRMIVKHVTVHLRIAYSILKHNDEISFNCRKQWNNVD